MGWFLILQYCIAFVFRHNKIVPIACPSLLFSIKKDNLLPKYLRESFVFTIFAAKFRYTHAKILTWVMQIDGFEVDGISHRGTGTLWGYDSSSGNTHRSYNEVEVVFLNHGGGSFDHIQKSVIFIMIRYLFRLHFHFALSILKMIRRTVPAIPYDRRNEELCKMHKLLKNFN